MKKLLLTVMVVTALFAASETMAKPYEKRWGRQESSLEISIAIGDRAIIKDYLRDHYRPKCPPGLAKKHNGCLPPGIAKKYAMGKALPPGIARKRLPGDLLSRLTPIAGYQYIQVDKDVLLISEATKHVVDAVTLLSALD